MGFYTTAPFKGSAFPVLVLIVICTSVLWRSMNHIDRVRMRMMGRIGHWLESRAEEVSDEQKPNIKHRVGFEGRGGGGT